MSLFLKFLILGLFFDVDVHIISRPLISKEISHETSQNVAQGQQAPLHQACAHHAQEECSPDPDEGRNSSVGGADAP